MIPIKYIKYKFKKDNCKIEISKILFWMIFVELKNNYLRLSKAQNYIK